jgi:hypothetical protein
MPEKRWKIGDGSRVDIPASECDIQISTGLPGRVKDQRGHRQGRLTVQEFAGFQICGGKRRQRRSIWLCKCDCGNFIASHVGFSKTLTQSCGCLYRDVLTDHGGTSKESSPELRKVHLAWRNQRQNCYCPTAVEYPTIGARGIKVCDRWVNDFRAFLEDVGLPPTLNHSLSRIDFDKNYEPSNVRWFSDKEQRKRLHAYIKRLKESAPPQEQPHKDLFILLVKQHPDANLERYCELFTGKTGIRTNRNTMHKNLKKLGLSRKEQRVALANS